MDHDYNLSIQFPMGAGGHWLKHFLESIINQIDFKENQNSNWHFTAEDNNLDFQIEIYHQGNNPDFILSGACKYNFWCNYFYKQIVGDFKKLKSVSLPSGKNVRIPANFFPSNNRPLLYHSNLEGEDKFFWLVGQARGILSQENNFNLNYLDLFNNPKQFYKTITTKLEEKNINFNKNYKLFLNSKNSFINSVKNIKNNNINTNHFHYKIWEIAYALEILGWNPTDFSIYEYFDAKRLHDSLLPFKSKILTETIENLYYQL